MIGDLTEDALATLAETVAGRIRGQVLGRESAADDAATAIAGAALVYIVDAAPRTPEAIAREAAIRLSGWMYGNRPHARSQEFTDPSGTAVKVEFTNTAATANGFRASGASALVSRYIRRRGGKIGAGNSVANTAAIAAPGTTIMRCGFAQSLPHTDTGFRWFGTANGVELDSTWSQPASFAFWIPGNVMSRVVAVALLRSTQPLFLGVPVTLGEFGPAEPYMYGNTAGMIRYTATTFVGQFSVPNDFRAVLGEAR